MQERRELHELVDRLPDPELPAAKRMLQSLLADPLWLSLLTARPDDEPYTEEQQRQDSEAQAAIERGEGIPHEEILREFGL
jgi:hypothetical protein